MANYPQELARDTVCQSHTGHMTGFWFLPARPSRLNTNEWMNLKTVTITHTIASDDGMIIELESVCNNRSWLILSTTCAFASEDLHTITWNLNEDTRCPSSFSNRKPSEYKSDTLLLKPLVLCHTGTAVAQWLRCCATNRKVAGSIPACVGFFIDIKSFRSHCGPGVDSASNRNEYQQYFLGVKAAGA